MAVNITVLSTFNDAGLKKARNEMDKLNKKVSSGLSTATKTAGAMGAGVLGAAGVAIGGLISIGTTFDSVYDSMRVNTGKTGAELEALKGSLKIVASNAATSFGDAGTVLSTFSSKLGLTGKPLEDMSIAVINLSNITDTDLGSNLDSVTKVMQNFGVMTQYQVPALDMLFRASQQSGIKVSELAAAMADSGPMLRQAGFDYSDAAAFIAQLSKAGIDASDVMPTLGKAVAIAGKKGISAGQYLDDAFSKIRNAPNDVVAASDAVTLFGAKGAKMAELIRSGAVSFDDFKKSISEGDTIAAATTDTEDFGEKFTKLKNRVMLALEPFATKAFEIVGEVFDKIGPKIDQVTKFFQENEGAMAALQIGLGALTIAALGLAGACAVLAIAELGVTWPLVLIIAAIALVIAAVVYMWMKFDWFRNGVLYVWATIKNAFFMAKDAIVTVFNAIVDVIKNSVIPFFKNTLIPIFVSIFETAKDVWGKISAVMQFEWEFVILPVLRSLKLFFDNVLKPKFEQFLAIVQFVWGIVAAIISFAWNNIIKPVFGFIVDGVQFIIDKFFTVKDAIGSAFSTVADAIKTPFKAAFNFIVDAWNGTVGGLGFTAPDWLKYIPGAAWFAGKSITVPTLTRWAHEGGIVGGAPGANVPMMLQTGEMVLSQDQQAMLLGRINGSGGGGGGVTINVAVSPTADKASIGQTIAEALAAYERRSGASWRAA
jgi:phage-related minor tail protein